MSGRGYLAFWMDVGNVAYERVRGQRTADSVTRSKVVSGGCGCTVQKLRRGGAGAGAAVYAAECGGLVIHPRE